MSLDLLNEESLIDGNLPILTAKEISSKIMFYFGLTLALLSTLIIFGNFSTFDQLLWLTIAPGLTCFVFVPDILDYLAHGFFPHHPWTHHPFTVLYFIPLMAIGTKFGDFSQLILVGAITWFFHLVLDISGLGIPLLWTPVRWNQPLRSYNVPMLNRRGILRFPRSWFHSTLVQWTGCLIGFGWYIVVLLSVVSRWS